jgi:hypothetical protein
VVTSLGLVLNVLMKAGGEGLAPKDSRFPPSLPGREAIARAQPARQEEIGVRHSRLEATQYLLFCYLARIFRGANPGSVDDTMG